MRPTCSVYVDTGHLLASAATRMTGTSLRSGIHVDYSKLVASLVDAAESRSGVPVLRVYWYRSAKNGIPDVQQERIGELAKVKLRLGRFGVNSEQKGVDLRIGLDLVAHARSNTSDVFFLVSGDDDLTEAVEEARAHGVQVVDLGVPRVDGEPHGSARQTVSRLATTNATVTNSGVRLSICQGTDTGHPTKNASHRASKALVPASDHDLFAAAELDGVDRGELVGERLGVCRSRSAPS
jgi:hypothetical protein